MNLPILNEWRRRYPNHDPGRLYERYWHARLACPGGSEYVWNEAWQTMESTIYGHPGQPKAGPNQIPLFSEISGKKKVPGTVVPALWSFSRRVASAPLKIFGGPR